MRARRSEYAEAQMWAMRLTGGSGTEDGGTGPAAGSGLHPSGRAFGPVVEGLVEELNREPPDLVIASGDFTMRARRSEYGRLRDRGRRDGTGGGLGPASVRAGLRAAPPQVGLGRTDPAVVEGLVEELNREPPDLVIASGDFTMRARRSDTGSVSGAM
jgi:3',5'-cyclic AMP phosphodiesterase CpdA